MVSIILPTYNRAYILKNTLSSYLEQELVSEIIVIDDASSDDTESMLQSYRVESNKDIVYIRNNSRLGAAKSKEIGALSATNEYVLFGEDDVILGADYVKVLVNKFDLYKDIGLISGRIIYLLKSETIENALVRFGNGPDDRKIFNNKRFGLNNEAYFDGDRSVPFTHSLYLTKKEYIVNMGMDTYYSKGNGYREETDFQLALISAGYVNYITNDTHCFHLNRIQVNRGGQNIHRILRYYWDVFYTFYLYDKYYNAVRSKFGLRNTKFIAKIIYVFHHFYELFIRPFNKLLHRIRN